MVDRLAQSGFSLVLILSGGCGHFELRGSPPQPFDAVIVPGCPSTDDGRLTRCQIERAIWASLLYRRGDVKHLIVSGAAVHSPYVEAEALAEALAALGVPPERIYLEPNALHTDENMYFSLGIAERLGFRSLAVVSQGGHASFGCLMLSDWGRTCSAIPTDRAQVIARHREVRQRLDEIRSRPQRLWMPLVEREKKRMASGWPRRPPSYLYYPYLALRRLNGEIVRPKAPPPQIVTWAERLRDVHRRHPVFLSSP
jgi:uncharacterized SAM-binding protein YcdF (DUF218 family)